MPDGCDETCVDSVDGSTQLSFLLNDSSDTPFIIYKEFEPDIFFPFEEVAGGYAYTINQSSNCDFGGGGVET